MNGLPGFSGAMNGRMLPHHPMFDRASAPVAAAGNDAAYPGYAEAVMNSRYAAAASAGIDPMLLQQQQELRRQDMLATAGGFAAAAAAPPNNASLLAHREEELFRINDAHNRIMEAELAARAMRDRVAAAQAAQYQQQQHHHAAQRVQDESFRADSIERIVALQEQQVQRQRDMEKLRQAEISEQTGRAFGGQMPTAAMAAEAIDRNRFLGAASAAYGGGGADNNRLAAGSASAMPSAQLAEEMALRERFIQRRILEEEALKQRHIQQQQHQHHQATLNSHQAMMGLPEGSRGGGDAAMTTEREHLTRLLQLQQMSDEDLIRRAAEVQSAQDSALRESLDKNKNAALQQQLLEAQLFRSGLQRFQGGASSGDQRLGLDMIDQAHADAAVASRMWGHGPEHNRPGQAHSPILQQVGIPQHSNNPNINPLPQPLRYFNNGIEVDMDGNPLAPNSQAYPTALVQANLNSAPSPSSNMNMNVASPDNNIIAKFLTVVVSRVPEIAPAVADLLPDGGDPMLLKREFPNVVDATLAELMSIQERFAKASDNKALDLLRRVTNCIAAIEPYKVDLSTADGWAPPPTSALSGMMRQTLPKPSMDPNNCQPLLPNNNLLRFAAMSAAATANYPTPEERAMVQQANALRFAAMSASAAARPPNCPTPEELAMVQQANAFRSQRSESQSLSPFVNNIESKEQAKPQSPADDLPLMAMYKSKKNATKKKKKKKKTNAPKLVHKGTSSKSKTPKLVHHALFKGAFDANEVVRKTAPLQKNTPGSPSVPNSSTTAEAGKTSRPAKKRRLSDEAAADDDEVNVDSIPVSNIYQKNGKVKNNSSQGPHGKLIDELFGASSKSAADQGDANTAESELSDKNEAKKECASIVSTSPNSSADAEKSVLTDDSEHTEKLSRVNSEDESQPNTDEDGHLDAASVLLRLMGK